MDVRGDALIQALFLARVNHFALFWRTSVNEVHQLTKFLFSIMELNALFQLWNPIVFKLCLNEPRSLFSCFHTTPRFLAARSKSSSAPGSTSATLDRLNRHTAAIP